MDRKPKGREAYPLSWPTGWERTERLSASPFKTGFGDARNFLFGEIRRMGGTDVTLSSNVPLNKTDGLPRANYTPDDPAVAVYFKRKGRDLVFACDRWKTVADNMHAIAKTIEALRGIERWGASEVVDRTFTGFLALPVKASSPWRDVLGFRTDDGLTLEIINSRARDLQKRYHPDNPVTGDRDKFDAVMQAVKDAQLEYQKAA